MSTSLLRWRRSQGSPAVSRTHSLETINVRRLQIYWASIRGCLRWRPKWWSTWGVPNLRFLFSACLRMCLRSAFSEELRCFSLFLWIDYKFDVLLLPVGPPANYPPLFAVYLSTKSKLQHFTIKPSALLIFFLIIELNFTQTITFCISYYSFTLSYIDSDSCFNCEDNTFKTFNLLSTVKHQLFLKIREQ